MSDVPPSGDETIDATVADILDRYCADAGRGLDPDPEAFLADHPEVSDDLAACLGGLAAMEELRTALAPPPERAESEPPRRLGNYEILGQLGRGGMGVVYRARQLKPGRVVALKMIRAADVASEADLIRFRNEAEILADLDHPNVVPIYEVGEEDGWLFYSMPLMDGGSLADQLDRFRDDPRAAAEVVKTVAFALRYVHSHNVLHRDLKPSNILLDRDGRPHVSDFGLAKRLTAGGDLTQSGAAVGTLMYMAPEQLLGKKGGVTWQTDVYGLGGIFYALLTGREPCGGGDYLDTLDRIRSATPESPRRLNPKVHRDLETICLKCLEKDPKNRYLAAGRVGDDLERWLQGKPIKGRPVGRLERVWSWCRRHPAAVGAVVAVAALLLALSFKAVSVARDRSARLEEEVLRGNRYAAKGAASMVLWQLDRFSGPVVEAANSESLRRVLRAGDRPGLERFVSETRAKYDKLEGGLSPFETWYVVDAAGTLLTVAPPPADRNLVGTPFPGRDYFRGAMARAREPGRAAVHVSRIYRAVNRGLYKFALSVAVRAGPEPEAPVVGVLSVTITTASALGSLRLDDGPQIAVLVGRHDLEPPRPGAPRVEGPEYLVLVHPAYDRGDEAVGAPPARFQALHRPRPGDEFLPDFGRELSERETSDADYRDPLAARHPDYAGRWLAGFAPVGNTEFVVIVQSRYEDAVGSDLRLLLDVLLWGVGALALGGLCVGVLAWAGVRRMAGHAG